MSTSEPTKVLMLAGEQHLSPHGFRPIKGNRVWIDDHGWMLFFVNFESSAFAKGSALDIGAHFLWSTADHVSFDIVRRIETFHSFEDHEQFARIADKLSRRAVETAEALRSRLSGFSAVAREFFWSQSGWPAYHKAIALGLSSSRWSRRWSSWYFSLLIANAKRDSPTWMHDRSELCARLREMLGQPTEFRGHVVNMINAHRTAIGLETKSNPLKNGA